MNTDTLDLIEQALDATLLELRKLSAQQNERKRAATPAQAWLADECIDMPEPASSLIEAIANPLKYSLMQQLHRIGRVLFDEVGTTDRVKEIAEWVAALQVEDYEFRMDALDNAFLGIGAGEDIWRH